MKILFLCTAHNSLSQRLYLALTSLGHDVSIEYALSDAIMQEAVELLGPDLVICPFLTTRVPREIFTRILTLIIHPGPPGDAGPSAIDWLIWGCDGSTDDTNLALRTLNSYEVRPGRTHWGVSVIQAIEQFDAGPVWAFEQFPVNIDSPDLTKSTLYRGAITSAAVIATKAALDRIVLAKKAHYKHPLAEIPSQCQPNIRADSRYAVLCVTSQIPFPGGSTCHRPLLKAAQRDFNVTRHSATQISRRLRSADTQPGVLSKLFGFEFFLYGGVIEGQPDLTFGLSIRGCVTKIIGVRNEALCFATCDGKGIWITHIRQRKGRDSALQPKMPAVPGLLSLGILTTSQVHELQWPLASDWSAATWPTLQDIRVDIIEDDNQKRIAHLHWEFYNGAMDKDQCSRLLEAMNYILSQSTAADPIHAVVLMGGSYFSNGIALNIAEAAPDPAWESWLNINAIDDIVHHLLHEFPSRGILTFAAIRGNAAAGGVALAAACDFVISGSEVVLNPAYRAIGLYGSEYHTITYHARCGKAKATRLLRDMQAMSPLQAQRLGLIDFVFPGTGDQLDDYIHTHVSMLLKPGCLKQGFWKANVDLSPAVLARARALELGEMSKDFWSPRSIRYHSRRFDFVRNVKPSRTPLRFAKHRRLANSTVLDEEESSQFDEIQHFKRSYEEDLLADLRKKIRAEINTPKRTSVIDVTPLEIKAPPVPSVQPICVTETASANAKAEILFSCYYNPVTEPLTPPETPFQPSVTEPFFDAPELTNGLASQEDGILECLK